MRSITSNRAVTKDRYRVLDQLKPHVPVSTMASVRRLTNEELATLWGSIKGYELRYVGDDLFQCEEP